MYIKAYLKIAPLHIFLVVLMIFFVFFVPNSFAQAITVTATGPTTFTIKIQNVHSWRIEERVGGQWGTLRTGWGSSASYSYTRPGGSYEFRLYNCYPVTNGCSTSTPKFVILEGNTPPNVPTVTSRVELGGIRVNWTLPAILIRQYLQGIHTPTVLRHVMLITCAQLPAPQQFLILLPQRLRL